MDQKGRKEMMNGSRKEKTGKRGMNKRRERRVGGWKEGRTKERSL